MERKEYAFPALRVKQKILVERTDRKHPPKEFSVTRIGSRVNLKGPSGQRLTAKIENLVRNGEDRGGRFRFSPVPEISQVNPYGDDLSHID